MKLSLKTVLAALLLAAVPVALAQDVSSDVKKTAKDTGTATKKAAKKTGAATEKATDKTADATKTAAKKTGHATKTAAKDTAKYGLRPTWSMVSAQMNVPTKPAAWVIRP